MYLTKMALNGRRRGAMKLLSSPQAMHAAVQSAFAPGTLEAAGGRALWRVDQYGHEISLYVVSPVEPDLTHVVEQAGWQVGEMWQTRDYKPLLSRLEAGQRWAFRLTANPVFHGYKQGRDWSDTKPLAHITVEQQRKWLLDRAARAGFRIVDESHGEPALRVVSRSTLRFGKGGHRVVVGTATFEGVLEVAEPSDLVHTLSRGLGRAKAYGCGLLTLAPLAAGD